MSPSTPPPASPAPSDRLQAVVVGVVSLVAVVTAFTVTLAGLAR